MGVVIERKEGVPIDLAPAGSICEIVSADEPWMVGQVCILPFSTDQSLVILNKNIASTDRTRGIKRVKPLQKGDSFTVTL